MKIFWKWDMFPWYTYTIMLPRHMPCLEAVMQFVSYQYVFVTRTLYLYSFNHLYQYITVIRVLLRLLFPSSLCPLPSFSFYLTRINEKLCSQALNAKEWVDFGNFLYWVQDKWLLLFVTVFFISFFFSHKNFLLRNKLYYWLERFTLFTAIYAMIETTIYIIYIFSFIFEQHFLNKSCMNSYI